jgi:putative peptidoglycan lipid II flippase
MNGFTYRYGSLIVLSGTGYLLSFCSQLLVSYYFGTSPALDAYWAGLALVNVLCFYLHPLREALVPAIHRAGLAGSDNAGRIFSAGLSLLGILVIASAMFLWTFSTRFSTWMVQTEDPNAAEAIVRLIPWLIPYMGLLVLSETLTSVLLSMDRVVFQAVVRLIASVVSIGVLIICGGLIGVPVLVLAQMGSLAVVVMMCLVSFRALRLRPVRNMVRVLREGGMFPLFLSLLGSYLFSNLYVLAERAAMIHLLPGLVSAFQYSTALVNVLVSLLAVPLASLLWPRFLADRTSEGAVSTGNIAARASAGLFILLILLCTFVWEHAEQIVVLLFGRGAFDASSAESTASALRATIFAAIPISIGAVCGRFIISLGDAHWQVLIGLANAAAGFSVIGIALLWQSSSIVQLHYLAANLAGVAMAILGYIRICQLSPKLVLRGFVWVVFMMCAVWSAALLAPQSSFGREKLQIVEELVVDGVMFVGMVLAVGGVIGLIRPVRVFVMQGFPVKGA